jgi:hypothetical protein
MKYQQAGAEASEVQQRSALSAAQKALDAATS